MVYYSEWICRKCVEMSNINYDLKKDTYKSKIHNQKNWKKTRLWWYGRIICEEEFYNTTFSFCTENNVFDRVYVDYSFICNKSYKLERKMEELLIKNNLKKERKIYNDIYF